MNVSDVNPPEKCLMNTHYERVRFGDTDAAGIVYYGNYYRWFEAGRAELMRFGGVPYAQIVDEGLFMPVVESWCRYQSPARYDDKLRVVSWVHEMKSASLVIAHQIFVGDRRVCHGGARLTCVNEVGRVRRIHESIRKIVNEASL